MSKKKPTKKSEPTEPKMPAAAADDGAELCKFVKFEQQIVHRRQLKGAPYNPRILQDEARRDLKANLERVGLLNGLVWNKRSGNLVSGHQRIDILDSLMRTDNYKIPVDVVDLDDKTEREQNIAFNNTNLTGDFDLQKLGEMFKGGEIEAANTGFSPAQMYMMFGDSPMVEQPEQLEVLAGQMREARERYEAIKKACGKRDDFDYYLVVFSSVEKRGEFLDAVGLPQNRFVDGDALAARVLKAKAS